ncbi:beta-galactosidase [Echinicola marina]|uniref:glycoside hydrolase family 2 protein n=1 Tax=Echinicola marina TaxID=2859768 RepID=UPI001CF6DE81|nr:sugar-binding domain-containing protein [Echinicola marina]UCS94030.1 beta-galactosidase [Echinicola marina]
MKTAYCTTGFIIACITFFALVPAYSQEKDGGLLSYEMKTPWTDQVDAKNVWSGYPRPQLQREEWTNLNGTWEYAISANKSTLPSKYQGEILVPFPVESALSGVKKVVGSENYLWYRRNFQIDASKTEERTLLHFGAVDWETVLFINGKQVGTHKGGYDAFTFDISQYVKKGNNELVLRVWDPTDEGMQARGKQVSDPKGIWYTPVTGIWQTVWLESVPVDYIENLRLSPDIDERALNVSVEYPELSGDYMLEINAISNGENIAGTKISVSEKSNHSTARLTIKDMVLWSPDNPHLYDLEVKLYNEKGELVDKVDSYFGMRKISLGKDGNGYTRIMLNNEPLFQFGLLDQGWWPDGLYTAPTEEAMVYDIKKTQEMGFNMLRKHVKVEPARFYYHCDKMGMLVWQDMPSGFITAEKSVQHVKHDALLDWERPLASAQQFVGELKAMIDNLYNFPSIVVWVPLNEGWGQYETEKLATWTKQYDPSRLVDAPSGWADRKVGDMIDVHLYPGPGMELSEANRASVLGEFGGLGLPVKDHLWWDKRNWGYLTYQDQAVYENEFQSIIKNLEGLISWGLSAAIYTQTTDVEGEVNGMITYDREVVKIYPGKVKKWIMPLYEPRWKKHDLVTDSEHSPEIWKVNFGTVDKDWAAQDYDDAGWEEQAAPFSGGVNPFLPPSSPWEGEELHLRKTFTLQAVPDNIYIKYYAPRSEAKVFINGHLVKTLNDGGGRKRHYTHILLEGAEEYLQEGENMVSVEVKTKNNEGAFDMGLYASETLNGAKTID